MAVEWTGPGRIAVVVGWGEGLEEREAGEAALGGVEALGSTEVEDVGAALKGTDDRWGD